MTDIIRIVVERYSKGKTEEIIREVIAEKEIGAVNSIMELGFRHSEQITILQKLQDQLLSRQAEHLKGSGEACPKCGNKVRLDGARPSIFHSVFTDHKVRIIRLRCGQCGWRSTPTVTSLFGTNIHPDLAKLQTEAGAAHTYRDAEDILNGKSCTKRTINNHVNIKAITEAVGLEIEKQGAVIPINTTVAAELIIQVDGGHVRSIDKSQRSFEALTVTVYRPENIRYVEKGNRGIIISKHCAASAISDNQESIKAKALSAAKCQGLNNKTIVTALCDGAANCWTVVRALEDHCASLDCILDWFHIAMKFQNIALPKAHKERLMKAKWCLWHGQVDKAIEKLERLQNLVATKYRQKIIDLYSYITNNKEYIVNYEARKTAGLVFTSQVAESTVESLINQRCKGQQHMQWSRQGLHSVLQVRTAIASNSWLNIWHNVIINALCSKKAA